MWLSYTHICILSLYFSHYGLSQDIDYSSLNTVTLFIHSKCNGLYLPTPNPQSIPLHPPCSCCCSVIQLCPNFATPWTRAHQASLSLTISWSLLKFMFDSVMQSNHLILCHFLLFLPSVFPSIRVFSNEWALHIKGQNIGCLALASVPPMNIQDWFTLGLTSLISFKTKGLSRVFFNTTVQKHQFFGAQLSL